ncbi:MAG: ABC transporter ATP-binding protein [Oscillospiraceae bacterium]|jgi:putative ABC transport system ATP-binding protein|nr:ABC transporter ATP-binding protein [Oscillospiraceae bacterium]
MLEIRKLHKFYGTGNTKTEVLRGIDCVIPQGELCVLLGPSGSGKSTLLNIIGGIEQGDEGSVLFDGQDLLKMKKGALAEYRREKLGFVFQFYNLVQNLTVKENIEVGSYLSKNPLPINDLLNSLGLWEHKDRFPAQLSGGQQQRCAIGRALIKNPAVLLCDEPTGALDYKTSKEILSLIGNIHRDYGTTILLVTHNEAIKEMAMRVLQVRDGAVYKEYKNENPIAASDIAW